MIKKQIAEIILKKREDVFNNKGLSAWSINNGLCDVFAESVLDEFKGINGISDMSLLDLVICDKFNNWSEFSLSALGEFNINPTNNLNKDDFFETLTKYADDTHVWIMHKDENNVAWHFDAECPEGVDNPMLLPTFNKFIAAFACGYKEKEKIIPFLKRWREHSEKNQVPSMNEFYL